MSRLILFYLLFAVPEPAGLDLDIRSASFSTSGVRSSRQFFGSSRDLPIRSYSAVALRKVPDSVDTKRQISGSTESFIVDPWDNKYTEQIQDKRVEKRRRRKKWQHSELSVVYSAAGQRGVAYATIERSCDLTKVYRAARDRQTNSECWDITTGALSDPKTKKRWTSTPLNTVHEAQDSTETSRHSSQQTYSPNQSVSDNHHMTELLTTVQKNLNVLSPKLKSCTTCSAEGHCSGGAHSKARPSSLCVLESHGNQKELYVSNGASLDLLQSVIQGQDSSVPAAAAVRKSYGSSSASSSSRELAENTPTLSCSVGPLGSQTSRTDNSSPCAHSEQGQCNKCSDNADSYLHLATLTSGCGEQPICDNTRTRDCDAGNVNHNAPSVEPGVCEAVTEDMVQQESRMAGQSSSPLHYVNLQQYDGYDEGYLYWLRSQANAKNQQTMATAPPYENVKLESHAAEYIDMQPNDSSKISSSMPPRSRNGFLSIHGSLRRNVQGHQVPAVQPDPASGSGAYVLLRNGMEGDQPVRQLPILQRRRGGSLDNILSEHVPPPSPQFCHGPSPRYQNSADPGSAESGATRNGPTTPDHEYISMNSFPPGASVSESKRDPEDENVFHAVQLPIKNRSNAHSRASIFNRCSSFSGVRSPNTGASGLVEEAPYLDMSSNGTRNSGTGPAMVSEPSPSRHRYPEQGSRRPPLNHSRSLDNELDNSYLDMTPPPAKPDYLHMSPVRSPGNVTASSEQALLSPESSPRRPFDNLISHQSYSKTSAKPPPEPLGSTPKKERKKKKSNKKGDKSSSDEDSRSESGSSVKSGTSGSGSGKPGLWSRLMRRNSSTAKLKVKGPSSQPNLAEPRHSVAGLPEDQVDPAPVGFSIGKVRLDSLARRNTTVGLQPYAQYTIDSSLLSPQPVSTTDPAAPLLPPEIPPKTYKSSRTRTSPPLPRPAALVPAPSPSRQPDVNNSSSAYMDMSVGSGPQNVKSRVPDLSSQQSREIESTGKSEKVTQEEPPPLPEKTLRGARTSVLPVTDTKGDLDPAPANLANPNPAVLGASVSDLDDDVFDDGDTPTMGPSRGPNQEPPASSVNLKGTQNVSVLLSGAENPRHSKRKNPNLTVNIVQPRHLSDDNPRNCGFEDSPRLEGNLGEWYWVWVGGDGY